MCTAIAFNKNGSFFGRNLDLEYEIGEKITFVPRNFPLGFKIGKVFEHHFAMLGTAHIAGGYPLFYDGINEHGLFAAALNFPESAVYFPEKEGMENVAAFEMIPFVLSLCSNIAEAKTLLKRVNVSSTDFSKVLKSTPLHWFFADKTGAITVEPLENGLEMYENPFGVLTNEPPFGYHKLRLSEFLGLSPKEPENRFSENLDLEPFSKGTGAFGLPGDSSSCSRFIKAAFGKENAISESHEESLSQVFHILESVSMIKGCVRLADGKFEKTVYSACADGENGIYYCKVFGNSRIFAVDMKKEDLEGTKIVPYPFKTEQDILFQNR